MCPHVLRVIFEGFRRQYGGVPEAIVAVISAIHFTLPFVANVLSIHLLTNSFWGFGILPEESLSALLCLLVPASLAFLSLIGYGLSRASAEFSERREVGVLHTNRVYASYLVVSLAGLFLLAVALI